MKVLQTEPSERSEKIMNETTLDVNLDQFADLIQKGNELIIDRYTDLDQSKAFCGISPSQFEEWFNEPMPHNGIEVSQLLDIVKERVMDTATTNIAPNMFAYVNAGGTQISILAEMLATAINQNVGKWHLSPAMSELEKRVIQWGAEFIGYQSSAGGVLVSGGSAANLTGLTVARNVYFEKAKVRERGLFGMSPFIVYASEEVHGCVDKSIELLGIGTENYHKIPVKDDYTIDLEALEQQIVSDAKHGLTPFCIVGSAGTVNTGAIDPMDKLADLAEKYGLWLHIDGAYGGLAAGTELVSHHYKGIERADSIAIDFHKWLYQPYEGGCTLVKDWGKLKTSYYKKASYLSTDLNDDGRFDFNEHQFQLSRNAKALKIWMSFKAYGSDRIKRMIEKDILLSQYLADQLKASPDFKVITEADLSVVCFQYTGANGQFAEDEEELNRINKDIIPLLEKDGRVFITGTTLRGSSVIRACLINHRLQKKNVDFLVETVREVGRKLG